MNVTGLISAVVILTFVILLVIFRAKAIVSPEEIRSLWVARLLMAVFGIIVILILVAVGTFLGKGLQYIWDFIDALMT